MLWSILKVLLFVGLALALAFGASFILETPGEVKVAFGGREFFLSPIGFILSLAALVILVLVVLKLIGFLVALFRFLMGDETAISRYFSRSRERRGFDALSDGMVAVASGDAKTALKKAKRAEGLLARPDLTHLLTAQAAELGGDRAKTYDAYKAMLPDDRTRPVALQGLTRLKIEEGDLDTALALAKKALALRPDNERNLRTLFELQSRQEDWAGARETLTASIHARLLPRDVGTRRDAVLVARRRAGGARGRQHRPRQRGGAAGQPAGADARPGRGAGGAGAYRERRQAQGGEDADLRLGRGAASRPRRRLRGRRARRDPGGAAQAVRRADRGRPRQRGEPAPRDRARARRGGLSRRAQGPRRSRRDRADDPQPGADGGDRARAGRPGRGGARLAREGAGRLARAAMGLRQLHPHPRRLAAGLRELRRLRHARLEDPGPRRRYQPGRFGDAAADHRSELPPPPPLRLPSPPRVRWRSRSLAPPRRNRRWRMPSSPTWPTAPAPPAQPEAQPEVQRGGD